MFTVQDKPTFGRTVEVNVPTDDGFRKETLKARFNVVPADDMDDYAFETANGTTEFLKRAVDHLDDLIDEEKKPMVYNEDLRDRLLAIPFLRQALIREYLLGAQGAKEGN